MTVIVPTLFAQRHLAAAYGRLKEVAIGAGPISSALAANGFFAGGRAYNAWSYWIAIGSGIVTIAGVVTALYQVRQARREAKSAQTAAQAAEAASRKTRESIQRFLGLADVVEISGISKTVCSLMSAEAFEAANERLCDLRRAMARLRGSVLFAEVITDESITGMIAEMVTVQATLTKKRHGPKLSKKDFIAAIHAMNKMDQELSRIRSDVSRRFSGI